MHPSGVGFSNEPFTVYLAHSTRHRNALDLARLAANVERLAYGSSFS
jgi:hypothetical protein